MIKSIRLKCRNCQHFFKKEVKEYKRQLKLGRTYFFCSLSCSVICLNSRRVCSYKVKNWHGNNNHNWKGGKTKHSKGYVYKYVLNHPNAKNNYVLEHRLVMEECLGRYLADTEIIHHCDKNKGNYTLTTRKSLGLI